MIIELIEQGNTLELSENIALILELAPFGLPAGISHSIFTAKGQILSASGSATPATIPAPSTDGHTLIADSSQATGWTTGVPNIELTGIPANGWIPETNTWTYSSVDGPTGIVSINADLEDIVSKGMRVSYQQSQALTAYWTFDSSSTPDVDPGLTMADVGTPTYTSGKFSSALTLDGSTDALSITDSAYLKPTGEFTIGVWIKTSSSSQQYVFQSFSNNAGVYAGIVGSVEASGFARLLIGTNTTSLNYVLGGTTINDGNFHYVVWTFRNNYAQIYVDGVLDASGYLPTPIYAGTNYIRIGCSCFTGSNATWFSGQIDDLFFINGYALDEKTIRDQYLAAAAQGTGNITVTKMGIITNVGAYSGGATLVTIFHGADYALVNSTISSTYYSPVKAPQGFPLGPEKWSVIAFNYTDAVKSSPTASVWYGQTNALTSGSLPSLDVPIGAWRLSYSAVINVSAASATAAAVYFTISTSGSTESDKRFTSYSVTGGASGTIISGNSKQRSNVIRVKSKTTYYGLVFTGNTVTTLTVYGSTVAPTYIIAECAYL